MEQEQEQEEEEEEKEVEEIAGQEILLHAVHRKTTFDLATRANYAHLFIYLFSRNALYRANIKSTGGTTECDRGVEATTGRSHVA